MPAVSARHLADLPLPQRAKVLNFDANFGFSSAERQFLQGLLGPDFSSAAFVRELNIPGGWLAMNEVELGRELHREIDNWLLAQEVAPTGPWAVLVEGNRPPFEGIIQGDSGTAWMPIAPWEVRVGAHPLLTINGGAFQTISGSLRTFDVFDAESRLLATFKSSFGRDRIAGLRRSWQERVKRLCIDLLFGVDKNVDTGLVSRLDALHSLQLSSQIASLEHLLPLWMDVQHETAAMSDGSGQTCIFRTPGRLLREAGKSALSIPYFATVFSRRKKADIFAALVAANQCSDVELACRLAGFYLGAWWELFERLGVIHLMPHAQNASIVLDSQGRTIGISLKDLRDAEVVRRYDTLTHKSVRLHAVCRQYLAFEMLAHPIYYDTIGSRLSLPERVFSFAFQMLRNHVVRGLADSVRSAGGSQQVERHFTHMVEVLAEGGSAADLGEVGLSRNASRSAARALRTRFARRWEDLCA